MKLLAYFSFIVAAGTCVHAADHPIRFFSSKADIYASARAAFAGGSVQELKVDNKKVAVLYNYASGAFSSDAAIYIEVENGWRLVAYYAPLLDDSIDASAEGGAVVLKAHQKKQLLLTVSVSPEK